MIKFIVLVSLLVLSCNNSQLDNYNYTKEELNIAGRKIYFKRRMWGMNGQDQSISLSPKIPFVPDTTSECVIKGLGHIYYKINADTLVLYVGKNYLIPSPLNEVVHIKQIMVELNWRNLTLDDAQTYRRNKGIKTF